MQKTAVCIPSPTISQCWKQNRLQTPKLNQTLFGLFKLVWLRWQIRICSCIISEMIIWVTLGSSRLMDSFQKLKVADLWPMTLECFHTTFHYENHAFTSCSFKTREKWIPQFRNWSNYHGWIYLRIRPDQPVEPLICIHVASLLLEAPFFVVWYRLWIVDSDVGHLFGRSRLKHLDKLWIDWHDILYRHSWSPDN